MRAYGEMQDDEMFAPMTGVAGARLRTRDQEPYWPLHVYWQGSLRSAMLDCEDIRSDHAGTDGRGERQCTCLRGQCTSLLQSDDQFTPTGSYPEPGICFRPPAGSLPSCLCSCYTLWQYQALSWKTFSKIEGRCPNVKLNSWLEPAGGLKWR